MDAETLTHIFEPFFTTRDASRGSGIGLYTVDAIVRQAEGEITATSTPGAGTVFTVDFPTVA
jgi:signal transduction histidine kinase